MIRLECLRGSYENQLFDFQEAPLLMGRGLDCDLRLADDACSRHHARIERDGDGYAIVDLGSTNGIRVNDDRVERDRLRHGDVLTLGNNVLRFLLVNMPEPITESGDPTVQSTMTVVELAAHLDVLHARSTGGNEPRKPLERDGRRHAHHVLHVAYRLSQAINATLDSEDLYSLLTQHIFDNFADVERVALLIRRHEGEDLELLANVSRGATRNLPISRAILRRVEVEQVGIVATDAASDERFVTSHSVALLDVRSLMCVPLVTRRRFLGVLYAENCSRPACFQRADLEFLTLLGSQAAFAIENAFLYEDLQVSFYETVCSLSNALEAKDKYTRGHSERVAELAVGIAEQLGLEPQRIEHVRTAARLHDIGKIAIGERVIGKSGRLTEEEFELIKEHPRLGVEILEPIQFLQPVLPFVLHHHERYNGRGYPDGLQGEAIPLEARILNIADAFDAMTTQRPYNKPRTPQEALAQCQREAGVSFDASCVRALAAYLDVQERLAGETSLDVPLTPAPRAAVELSR